MSGNPLPYLTPIILHVRGSLVRFILPTTVLPLSVMRDENVLSYDAILLLSYTHYRTLDTPTGNYLNTYSSDRTGQL